MVFSKIYLVTAGTERCLYVPMIASILLLLYIVKTIRCCSSSKYTHSEPPAISLKSYRMQKCSKFLKLKLSCSKFLKCGGEVVVFSKKNTEVGDISKIPLEIVDIFNFLS